MFHPTVAQLHTQGQMTAVQAISTKLGTVMLFDPLKNLNFENPRWRPPPSWKIKNRDISATIEAILTKFGIVMQFRPLDRSNLWKIMNPFAAKKDDKSVMRPFAKLTWTLVIWLW